MKNIGMFYISKMKNIGMFYISKMKNNIYKLNYGNS